MIDIIYKPSENVISMPVRAREKETHDILCRDFIGWLQKSLPGDKYRYYFGDMVAGKSIARLAYRAYENGEVILYQKKEGTLCGYWAQRKKRWE